MQRLYNGQEQVDPAAVQSAVDGMFATVLPSTETVSPALGGTKQIPYADHAHARLTSVTQGTVASGNTALVAFTRSFASEPGIDYQELPPTSNTVTPAASDTDNAAQPTSCKVIAWTKGPTALLPDAPAGAYTGCMVRIWKSQTVPQNLATLLLGGVFNLFAAGVVGVRFSLIAVARSDV